MCNLRIGRASRIGEDESEDDPTAVDENGGLVGYTLSNDEIEIEDEFKLSFRSRCTANPDAGIG